MDTSKSLDHYANRRDLLRGFLEEYALLTKEVPELAAQLSFSGFVDFSFAYFRIGELAGGVEGLSVELKRVRQQLPAL